MISDYEKSIIGTFSKGLLERINDDEKMRDDVEIYFTITKFDNDYGFSLIHQEENLEEQQDQQQNEPNFANEDMPKPSAENIQNGTDALNNLIDNQNVDTSNINNLSGENIGHRMYPQQSNENVNSPEIHKQEVLK